jgi:2'-hydroxyisoflavone reductase
MTTRRRFLENVAVSSGAAFAGGVPPLARAEAPIDRASRRGAPLSLLILGGTGFIGPHLVRHAVALGHRVTIFTRGRRQADLPASVIRLKGDRNGDLKALEGKKWDAVVDDNATNPEWVRLTTALLKGNVSRYLSQHKIEEAIPWAMLKGNDDGMMSIRHARAEAAGLRYRSLAATVRDTQAWWTTVPESRRKSPKFAISPALETEALAAWHARKA